MQPVLQYSEFCIVLFLCHHLLLVSSVKQKLERAEVGVEGGEGEGEE